MPANNANGVLFHFIADVVRSTALREEFLQSPDVVIERYGLDKEQVAALTSFDPEIMADIARREVVHNVASAIAINYPSPESKIESVEPTTFGANSATNLTIRGTGLMSEALITLTDKAGKAIAFKGSVATGAFELRVVTVGVTLPGGEYQLTLQNAGNVPALEAPYMLRVG